MKRYKKLKKLLIFDLDGTLADTLDDITRSLNIMLDRLGYPNITRTDAYNNINNGAKYLVKNVLPGGLDDGEVERCLEIYNSIYRENFLVDTALYDGIAEMCRELKANGIRLAVLSNKGDELVKKVIGALLPDVFLTAVGFGVYPAKPDPTGPLTIARDVLGAEPEETVFCGDSDVDIRTAINAGMLPAGVSWGYRPAELLMSLGAKMIVNDPKELVDFILN